MINVLMRAYQNINIIWTQEVVKSLLPYVEERNKDTSPLVVLQIKL